MSDLVAFLAARLDEDEVIAKDASDERYLPLGGDHWWQASGGRVVQRGYVIASEPAELIAADLDSFRAVRSRHIARHDPARVLREVAAKRAIVAQYLEVADAQFPDADGGRASASEDALRHLAAVYSDHPEYDENWKPY